MSWEPIVYRDIWADDLRLIIGGRDVTYFRRKATQYGGYQLQQPYGYGPADFSFPQITGLEVSKLGVEKPLKWLRSGALARLVPVKDGVKQPDVWRGIVSTRRVVGGTIQVHCDGEASGRLALRDRHPAPFWLEKDRGEFVAAAFDYCGLPFTPKNGPDTGLKSSNRGGGTDYLQWVDGHLTAAITKTLDQWTVIPAWVNGRHTYKMVKKDTTTIHATIFYGAHGVTEDLASDMQEEPNNFFGSGVAPNGQKWNHTVYPGLEQGEAADYPIAGGGSFGVGTTNADTIDGFGISVMQWMLIGRGYMDKDDAGPTYDTDTADAVEDLQEDAGLPQTGVMDQATWDKLYDLSTTGLNLRQARQLPLAQGTENRKWNLTASGALASRNPDFDADVVEVDVTIDHAPGTTQGEARRWSRRQLRRLRNGPNWVGTIELDGADVFAGNVTAATVNPTPMSALDLRPGMNVMLRHFDGHTRFHVAGINVDGDRKVRLAVDTKARDLHTVGQIIARNKESRRNPAREFVRETRGRSFDSLIVFNKMGGVIPAPIRLGGNRWNVFQVLAGQSGTLEWLKLQLLPACEFVMGISAYRPGPLNQDVGSPWLVDADGNDISNWTKPSIQRMLKNKRLTLYTAGSVEQPCGYSPGAKIGRNGERSDDPLTGEHEDDGGINFHTFQEPVLYVSIYPDRDTVLQPGRIMKLLQTEGY